MIDISINSKNNEEFIEKMLIDYKIIFDDLIDICDEKLDEIQEELRIVKKDRDNYSEKVYGIEEENKALKDIVKLFMDFKKHNFPMDLTFYIVEKFENEEWNFEEDGFYFNKDEAERYVQEKYSKLDDGYSIFSGTWDYIFSNLLVYKNRKSIYKVEKMIDMYIKKIESKNDFEEVVNIRKGIYKKIHGVR